MKVRETPGCWYQLLDLLRLLKGGNQEFPEIMNRTPGVYTKQGGGYGDSRLSLRGFDQRNTSFLINGQPVNDMENGWVYWSNWQGLTDVIQEFRFKEVWVLHVWRFPLLVVPFLFLLKPQKRNKVVLYLKLSVIMDIIKQQLVTTLW